jgi:hypothetical protein
MAGRVEPKTDDRVWLLEASRRRCCLCAYLDGDWRQKKGQIAHIDRNPSNSKRDNLAYLCLDHHDQHDSTPSVSKGTEPAEVRKYRDRLHHEVEDVIAKGVVMADDVALVPYVIAVGAGVTEHVASVNLRNFTATPGLVTEVVVRQGLAQYRWVGKLVIEGNGSKARFEIPRTRDSDVVGDPDRPTFEIEVCDLAEVVTRRRTGYASQQIA